MSSGHSRAGGFTLIELIVVVSVVAILAATVAPSIFRNVGDAKIAAAKADLAAIGLALDTYALHSDRYPTTAQGLEALARRPETPPVPGGWRGPYLRKGAPRDPWGNPYQYRSPGAANPDSYDLWTFGRDGREGGLGEDADLRSWGGAQ